MVTCIARAISENDVVAQGINTPMVATGYQLAKLTHAPNATFVFTDGNTLVKSSAPLSLLWVEKYTIGDSLYRFTFPELVTEILSAGHVDIEFFRPAQIDPQGNMNNVSIGLGGRPKVRLPGVGGITEAVEELPIYCAYVPRHDSTAFVQKLDFKSSTGLFSSGQRGKHIKPKTHGLSQIITDLCVLELDHRTRRMLLKSVHQHSSIEEVIKKTGFQLRIPKRVPTTVPPSKSELELIRQRIDPLGLRSLERLPSRQRTLFLTEYLERELARRN